MMPKIEVQAIQIALKRLPSEVVGRPAELILIELFPLTVVPLADILQQTLG